MKNLIDRDKLIEWIKKQRDNHRAAKVFDEKYDDGVMNAFTWTQFEVAKMPIEKQIEPTKRCDTCNRYSVNGGCDKGWYKKRDVFTDTVITERMFDRDGQYCRDWQQKEIEKQRIWSCLNCGEDIRLGYGSEKRRSFYHVVSNDVQCTAERNFARNYSDYAIPDLDKPMRTE